MSTIIFAAHPILSRSGQGLHRGHYLLAPTTLTSADGGSSCPLIASSLWVEATPQLGDAGPLSVLVGVPDRSIASAKPCTVFVALLRSAPPGVLLFMKIPVVTGPSEPSSLSWSKMIPESMAPTSNAAVVSKMDMSIQSSSAISLMLLMSKLLVWWRVTLRDRMS